MLKKLIIYLTPKKPEAMAKHNEEIQHQQANEIKKLTKALKKSNEDLKILKKQFGFDEQHFISETIKANDKLLEA